MSLFRITIDLVDTVGYSDAIRTVQTLMEAMLDEDIPTRSDFYILDSKVTPARFVVPE